MSDSIYMSFSGLSVPYQSGNYVRLSDHTELEKKLRRAKAKNKELEKENAELKAENARIRILLENKATTGSCLRVEFPTKENGYAVVLTSYKADDEERMLQQLDDTILYFAKSYNLKEQSK